METPPAEQFETLLKKIETREQTARRRSLLYSAVPVFVALAVAVITSLYVRAELRQLERAQIDENLKAISTEEKNDSLQILVNTYQNQLEVLNAAVDSVRDQAVASFRESVIKPRVYLHILREDQRARARRVKQYLEANEFVVPGIDQVSAGPEASELRFFRSGEQTGAENILRVCRNNGYDMKLRDLSARYENATGIRQGHYEIWFGDDF
jgi:hypothetical protein